MPHMPCSKTVRNLKPRVLLEYASGMTGWKTFSKLKAIMLQERAAQVPGCEAFGEPKAIVLLKYAFLGSSRP